jgi:hypothetical protein
MSSLRQRYLQREHADFKGLNKTEKQPFPKPKKIPDHVKSSDGSSPDNGALREAKTHYDPSGRLTSHTIEAHGLKGFKRTPWRKTFKHADHLNDWAEKNDAEVHGTRDLEAAKHGNLSPGVSEASISTTKARKEAHTNVAHKGYLITPNPIYGEYHVSKGGHHITTQKSLEQAKKAIDSLSEAYAAPNTGNNNYAQNLPASISTTKARIADTMAENTEDKDGGATKRAYDLGVDHGLDGKPVQAPADINHASAYMDGHKAGTKRRMAILQHDRIHDDINYDEMNPIVEASKARRESTMFKNVKRSQDGVPVTAPKPIDVKSKKGRVATKLDNSLEGLARRRKNSGGLALLMPQAEAYVAPNTGNSNYAQNLPAGTDTARKPVKRSVKKDSVASTQDSVAQGEDVIMDMDQLTPIFESYMTESKQLAWNKGYSDGIRGNELPTKISHERFGEHQHHYHAGVAVGNAKRIKELNQGQLMHVGEELKVGDDDQEQKKVRGTNTVRGKLPTVKRKYLGKTRGTTATGKPAHVVDVQPVIGADNRNHNKTTPSGQKKRM